MGGVGELEVIGEFCAEVYGAREKAQSGWIRNMGIHGRQGRNGGDE